MSNSLDHYVGPALDPNCLKKNYKHTTAAFYQGLYYLLRQNRSSEKEKYLELITCDPLIYIYIYSELSHIIALIVKPKENIK